MLSRFGEAGLPPTFHDRAEWVDRVGDSITNGLGFKFVDYSLDQSKGDAMRVLCVPSPTLKGARGKATGVAGEARESKSTATP